MISCRKFIQLSISFRSVRVSTGAKRRGHRLQLNHNDFVFNLHFFDAEARPASIVHIPICTVRACKWGWGERGLEKCSLI